MLITQIRFNNFTELKNRFRLKEAALGIPEYGELARFGDRVGISSKYLLQYQTQANWASYCA